MANILNYITEAFEEIKTNVTWPEWAEVQRLTIIVALFSVLFALATSGVDMFFEKILSQFFNILKG